MEGVALTSALMQWLNPDIPSVIKRPWSTWEEGLEYSLTHQVDQFPEDDIKRGKFFYKRIQDAGAFNTFMTINAEERMKCAMVSVNEFSGFIMWSQAHWWRTPQELEALWGALSDDEVTEWIPEGTPESRINLVLTRWPLLFYGIRLNSKTNPYQFAVRCGEAARAAAARAAARRGDAEPDCVSNKKIRRNDQLWAPAVFDKAAAPEEGPPKPPPKKAKTNYVKVNMCKPAPPAEITQDQEIVKDERPLRRPRGRDDDKWKGVDVAERVEAETAAAETKKQKQDHMTRMRARRERNIALKRAFAIVIASGTPDVKTAGRLRCVFKLNATFFQVTGWSTAMLIPRTWR